MNDDSPRSRRGRERNREADRNTPPSTDEVVGRWTTGRWGCLILLAGWLLPQVLLLGPALIGRTVNLPVDLLAVPHLYLPDAPPYRGIVPHHGTSLLDLVLTYPAAREFAAKELRAGRLPLWQSANFAGTPFAGWCKYSPFEVPYYLVPSPVTLAWMSLLQLLTCGVGMWLFLRFGLGLSYWPAALASWCAPLTGDMTLWQGHPVIPPVCWFPWLLLLVCCAVKRPWGWSCLGVAGVTALMILSGGTDVGGLVLISSGLFLLWLLGTRASAWQRWRGSLSAAVGIGLAWLLGFLLSAPYTVPMAEYVRTGARVEARAGGNEERPPVGLSALPSIALPDFYGRDDADSMAIDKRNRLEGAGGACAGLVALFWLAPLAWCSSRFRRETVFFTLLACLGLSWTLSVPGLVDLMRIPPFNLFSYNRWVFATAMSVLVLAAIGLEQMRTDPPRFRRWFIVPMLVTAAFGLWCFSLAIELPEPLLSQLEMAIRHGQATGISLERLGSAQRSFTVCYAIGGLLSVGAGIGWLASFLANRQIKWWRMGVVALVPAQLIWFAWTERRQADRALYYPPVAALEELTQRPPGRIWGIDCFPPYMNRFAGLQDVRGNDAVDPGLYVSLFQLAKDAGVPNGPYAATMEALPQLIVSGRRVKLHPVADLLNVRYLVLRTPPPQGFPVVIHRDDYWIAENRDALPRCFVPRSVRVVASDREASSLMANRDFDPRQTVVMSAKPDVADTVEGTAAIRYDTPTRASLDVDLRGDGMVVISDYWDPGWRARLDGAGENTPIHRVDVALRGVRVPRGRHTIEMTYEPESVPRGFKIASIGGLCCLVWCAGLVLGRRGRPSQRGESAGL